MIALLILNLLFSINQTQNDAIVGRWQDVEDSNRIMEFYRSTDGLYYAKISNPKDKYNGKTTFKKLKYDAQKQVFTGSMSPPDIALELNATLNFESGYRLKAYISKFFTNKTIYLKKIN